MMSVRPAFISLAHGASRRDAASLMRMARVRHLPVLRGGRLVGVLSHRDLLEAERADCEARMRPEELEALGARPIDPLVRGAPVTVGPDCPPARAAELMVRHGIGFLPVVRDGELVGIVTESDLLRLAYGPGA